jgi:hypothetical protein
LTINRGQTANLFSPKISSNMNMFTINPETNPKIVNVLDPHFDMTDGLTLRHNSVTDRRGSMIEPQSKKLDTVILTNEE